MNGQPEESIFFLSISFSDAAAAARGCVSDSSLNLLIPLRLYHKHPPAIAKHPTLLQAFE